MDPRVCPCLLPFTTTRRRMKAFTISPLDYLPAQEMEVGDLTAALHTITGGKGFDALSTMHTGWMPTNLMPEPKEGGSRGRSRPILIHTDMMVVSHLAMFAAIHLREEIPPASAIRQLPST
jgi:hypothetical protein